MKKLVVYNSIKNIVYKINCRINTSNYRLNTRSKHVPKRTCRDEQFHKVSIRSSKRLVRKRCTFGAPWNCKIKKIETIVSLEKTMILTNTGNFFWLKLEVYNFLLNLKLFCLKIASIKLTFLKIDFYNISKHV